jgi:chromosome segregation ATPase
MLETKRDEIERLTEHATMREDGLTCSENMLETDTKAFLKFFDGIKKKTQEASKELDKVRKDKNEKNNDLRNWSDKI